MVRATHAATRLRLSALLLSLALTLLITSSRVYAFAARLDIKTQGRAMTGTLQLAAGGAVSGSIALDLPTTEATGPQLQTGGRAVGRYQLAVTLTGTRAQNAIDAAEGVAELDGTFTTAGQTAKVSGRGTFSAIGNEAGGVVRVVATWPSLSVQGGGLTTPQRLGLRLPEFYVLRGTGNQGQQVAQQTSQPPPAKTTNNPAPGAATTSTPTPPTTGAPGVAVGTVGAAGTGANPPPAAGSTSAAKPAATPSAKSGTLEVQQLQVAVGGFRNDDDEVIVNAQLPARTEILFVSVKLKKNAPAATDVQVVVLREGQEHAKETVTLKPGEKVLLEFDPGRTATFQPGSWSIVLERAGNAIGTLPFTVAAQ